MGPKTVHCGKYINNIYMFISIYTFLYLDIRSFIPKFAAIIFANAFKHFHIDYCNSLFYGLLKYSINHLQKIQNSVVRIVTCTSRSSHITPILKSLH